MTRTVGWVGSGWRSTMVTARRTGLPVSTASRSGVPGSDTAAWAPSRTAIRLASPGAAFCSWTTVGTRASRADTTQGSDAYPPTPNTTRGRVRRRIRRAATKARAVPASAATLSRSAAGRRLRWRPRPGSRSTAKPASGTAVASRPRRAPTKRRSAAGWPRATSSSATANAG